MQQKETSLQLSAPDGYTPERHAELLKDMRIYMGLPEKTKWGSGQPPAIVFEPGRSYAGMHCNSPEFRQLRAAREARQILKVA